MMPAFDVYPDPQVAPLEVAAGSPSPLIAITERAAGVPATMFIRVVKLGPGCAASGPPYPTIRLKAGTGAAVDIPTDATVVAIFNLPPGQGGQVANARLLAIEAGDVYLVRVRVLQPGSSWHIQLVNNDPAGAAAFTWVVADDQGQTRQPWIDVPTTLGFEVFPGRVQTGRLRVVNRGTGPLELEDRAGVDLGAGFALTSVPAVVDPNACADAQLTFTGPDEPGNITVLHTFSSNDLTARLAPKHNQRVTLKATTGPRPLWLPGDILVTDFESEGGTGGVIRVDPRTGAQTKVSSGNLFNAPGGIVVVPAAHD